MTIRDFQTEGTPTISIMECLGDLRVRSWDKPTVQVRSDDDLMETQQEGNTIMVKSNSDTRGQVPAEANLKIQQANSMVRIANIQGYIEIESVLGDLSLRNVGTTKVNQANSDFSARDIHGDLTVESVVGDMNARTVSGRFQVQQVGRDLGLRMLQGDAHAERVVGDIRLRSDFGRGTHCTLKAGGDIVARVPADADANFDLRSERNEISVRAELEDKMHTDQGVTGRLGDGSATVILEAGRDVILIAQETEETNGWGEIGITIGAEFGTEFATLADEIASQIENQMDVWSTQLEHKLANLEIGLASLDQKAARAAERAARKAQAEVERAADKLRRKAELEAEKARRKARVQVRRRPTRPLRPQAPTPPAPPSDPVSNSERMAILNMVAEGKITIEQAEKLLEALKG